MTCGVAQTRILKSAFAHGLEIRVLVETQPSHWSEARILRTCLLIIFKQLTELPPKFSNSAIDWDRFWNTLDFMLVSGSP